MNFFESGRITFITTERCNAECAHCLMECSPKKKHTLSHAQMRNVIDSYRKKHLLSQVIFSGGEPTLLGDELLKTISYCASLGIMTRMVTNCFWAKNDSAAERMLKTLRSSGLDEINISLDDYHAEYVPAENVLRVWELTKPMDFISVVLANCSEPGNRYTPESILSLIHEDVRLFDRRDGKIHDIPLPSQTGTTRLLCCSALQKTGRASEKLTDAHNWLLPLEQLRGGCPDACSDVCVSFDNHLWMCCGIRCADSAIFDFGSISDSGFDACTEAAADSVIVNAFHYLGPALLAEFIHTVEPSIIFPIEFHNCCEICAAIQQNPEAVNVLRKYPGYLFGVIEKVKKSRMDCSDNNA